MGEALVLPRLEVCGPATRQHCREPQGSWAQAVRGAGDRAAAGVDTWCGESSFMAGKPHGKPQGKSLFVPLVEEQKHSYSTFKTQLRCYLLRNPPQMPGGRARSTARPQAPPHLVFYGIQWGSFCRRSSRAVSLEREEPSGAPWLRKVVQRKWAPVQEDLMDKGKAGGNLDQQSPEDGHPDCWLSTCPKTENMTCRVASLGPLPRMVGRAGGPCWSTEGQGCSVCEPELAAPNVAAEPGGCKQ